MFRSNRVEPTIIEEEYESSKKVSDEGKVVPFDSKTDEDDPPVQQSAQHVKEPVKSPVATFTVDASIISIASRMSINARRSTVGQYDGSRRGSSVAFIMDRVHSQLKKTLTIQARKQLFQTQKFFTPFKRWLFGFYDGKFEPPTELALSDLKDNKSGAWMRHPETMCCVHIIQVQIAIYRKASLYRLLETYILTGIPMWGTFLLQGCIIYNLWIFMRSFPVDSEQSGFCTNSFLLQLATLVAFIMFTVYDNTYRFEANSLVALSPLYGRLPNAKKFDLEQGDVKPGMHNLIMKRKFWEFMRSKDNSYLVKFIYICTMCSLLFDIWISIAITYIGSKYIATSVGVSDVIQSAVALSFIYCLGDVVFKQTYSDSLIEDMQSIHILVPTNESDWESLDLDHKFLNNNNNGHFFNNFTNNSSIPPFASAMSGISSLGSTSGSIRQVSQQPSIGSTAGSGSGSSTGDEESLDEHILFLNNNVMYNAFFVVCLIVIPIFVAGMLVFTRYHYCGTSEW